jgi:histidine triad (HIT) family protein
VRLCICWSSPKKPSRVWQTRKPEDQLLLGHLLLVARQLAKEHGVEDSFRLLINNGEGAGQTVFHLHLHILGNDSYSEADMSH